MYMFDSKYSHSNYYYRKKRREWSHIQDCDEQTFRDKIRLKVTNNMNDVEHIRERVKYIPIRYEI